MDIKNKFREELLLHESEVIMEGKFTDVVKAVVEFLKKNIGKLAEFFGIPSKYKLGKLLIKKLRKSGRDFRAGILDPKNPNFDKQARIDAVDTVKDLAKLLSLLGMNITLNYFFAPLGFAAGAVVLLFRKLAPEKIADFLTLAIEKGQEKLTEMMSLLEDMSYFGADDATQDEYKIGLT